MDEIKFLKEVCPNCGIEISTLRETCPVCYEKLSPFIKISRKVKNKRPDELSKRREKK